jgi:hypothetical protein
MENTATEFRVAVIATRRGFQDFMRDIYFEIYDNPFYKIKFIEVNMAEKLRGSFFKPQWFIIHAAILILTNINKY